MVQVNINITGVRRKLSPQAQQQGQRALANQALADMNQFVPADETALRQSATIATDGSAVNYNTPYAKEQFYGRVGKGGYPVRNYTTPGTGPRWDEKAKSIHMKDWEDAFKKGADW